MYNSPLLLLLEESMDILALGQPILVLDFLLSLLIRAFRLNFSTWSALARNETIFDDLGDILFFRQLIASIYLEHFVLICLRVFRVLFCLSFLFRLQSLIQVLLRCLTNVHLDCVRSCWSLLNLCLFQDLVKWPSWPDNCI